MAKKIKLVGYGEVAISPLKVVDEGGERCLSDGTEVTSKMEGRGKLIYVTGKGDEVPSSSVCKKFIIDDEEVISERLQPSKEIEQDSITEVEDNSIIYSAIERKIYVAMTDSPKLHDLIINQRKSLTFPFVAGRGWKIALGVLTYWKNKMVLIGCRGNIDKVIEQYQDEEVTLSIVPNKSAKKLLKVVC